MRSSAYIITLNIFLHSLLFLYALSSPVTALDYYSLKRGVVVVSVYDESRKKIATGSGFFISHDTVVTCAHVILGAKHVTIRTSEGRTFEVTSVKRYSDTVDLVELKVNALGYSPTILKLNYSLPKEGEKVIVIGHPLSLEWSITEGIVSAIRGGDEIFRLFGVTEMIQFSAPISHGNSGSPLFNARGEVIGIVTMGIKPSEAQNLNFAIPVKELGTLKTCNCDLTSSNLQRTINRIILRGSEEAEDDEEGEVESFTSFNSMMKKLSNYINNYDYRSAYLLLEEVNEAYQKRREIRISDAEISALSAVVAKDITVTFLAYVTDEKALSKRDLEYIVRYLLAFKRLNDLVLTVSNVSPPIKELIEGFKGITMSFLVSFDMLYNAKTNKHVANLSNSKLLSYTNIAIERIKGITDFPTMLLMSNDEKTREAGKEILLSITVSMNLAILNNILLSLDSLSGDRLNYNLKLSQDKIRDFFSKAGYDNEEILKIAIGVGALYLKKLIE